jgi:PadR family transcriptional regulator PadR
MAREALTLMKGTLDLLILKTVSLKPQHGYEIARWVRARTDDALQIENGALYQALFRLEARGLLRAEWRISKTGREVRFYELTREGKRRLDEETRTWQSYVKAMHCVLSAVEV